jgi:16S rRNA (cytosine1402-N4)-methyltransferase
VDVREAMPAGPVHQPVLPAEVVEWMMPRPGAVLVDGTVGAGGHARLLAERLEGQGMLIGLDRDPAMLEIARRTLAGLPAELFHAAYDEFEDVLDLRGIEGVDGILVDLGLSSDQLQWADRGFSFQADGPLDMRFDPSRGETAAHIINTYPEQELADIFFQFGEERHSRRVARRIVERRKTQRFETTADLAYVVRGAIPGKWGQIDPATRVFQALRIAVNEELERLDALLERGPNRLKVGGRFAVISFHSLEDRRVKQAFRADPRLEVLTKKVVVASAAEILANPRSRSAKLRVAQRCPNPNGPESSASTPPRGRRGRT